MHYDITAEQFRDRLVSILSSDLSQDIRTATYDDIYKASALIVRSLLSRQRKAFMKKANEQNAKRIYYLSIEFLLGRSLRNNLLNMGLMDVAAEAFRDLNLDPDLVFAREPDAGLGNGGLGRLAACYMDGLASDCYVGTGYSILYEYGIFKQVIEDGWQREVPDNWLPGGEVWLKSHPNQAIEVRFGGRVEEIWADNHHHTIYNNYQTVLAVPYDMFISGYDSEGVSKLRFWKAEKPSIDMDAFNSGDYLQAIMSSGDAELISKILYPNDNHIEGKILRLKQQYFLCCASINEIVNTHMNKFRDLASLPDKVSIHINDTHPTLAIAELIRILVDDCGFEWDEAYSIASRTFSYTNHTVLPEALEKWDVNIFQEVLPRIYEIIVELNRRAREDLFRAFPGDTGKVDYMSLINGDKINMANICCYVCHSVNGVSQLHSEILKNSVFHDYYMFAPDKFTNVTNGIAYRRWLLGGNPRLTALLDELIGPAYRKDAYRLKELEKYRDDPDVLDRLARIKKANKEDFSRNLEDLTGEKLNPDSIFDVQAKRLHEYKRQHLNVLNIIAEYLRIKADPSVPFIPKTYIFGAKAAPGYYLAKEIIRLIFAVKKLVESDPDTKDRLHVVFLENYSVTLSEMLMPASEISEQISLAGFEASGTGNMKFMVNGAVTLGTFDGANIEIKECCGDDNFIQFGMLDEEADRLRDRGYRPADFLEGDDELKRVLALISDIPDADFSDIVNDLTGHDQYMVLADFRAYRERQKRVQEIYSDSRRFSRMSLMNIANSGKFSADRSVDDYARDIWGLSRVR